MGLKKCPECGKGVSEKASVCPNCGYHVNENAIVKRKGYKEKQQISMMLCIALAIAVGSICLVVGVFIGKSTVKMTQSVTQNQEKKIVEKGTDDEDNKQTETVQKIGGIQTMEIGDVADVTHEYGEYEITIEHVRFCDWLTRANQGSDGLNAVLIECDISNISYEDPYNEIFWLNNMLSVTDSKGYVLETLDFSYDDGEYTHSPEIPNGSKAKVVVAYKIKSDETSININLNDQYTWSTSIEQ